MPTMALADQEKLYLIERLRGVTEALKRGKEQAKEEAHLYLGAAISAATSGALGYYEGRKGTMDLVGGFPADIAVASAAFLSGFFLKDRELAKYLYAAGMGGANLYTYRLGKQLGAKMAQPTASSNAAVAGMLPAHTHQPGLSDQEISRLIDAARAMG